MGEVCDKPSVSVIIPTFNRGPMLSQSIRSVLAQTFTDIELIVVDDCSTDDTVTQISTFTDPRLRYIRHHTNKGAAAARNTGIGEATGEWIAFQDSDDIWLPDKLKKQMEIFYSHADQNVIVYCGFIRWKRGTTNYIPERNVRTRDGNILHQLLHGNFVSTQTMIVPRHCLERVGYFDPSLRRFQDWELAIRLAEHFEFKLIDEPLVIAHDTEQSISRDNSLISSSLSLILDKHLGKFESNPDAMATILTNIGHYFCIEGNMQNGRKNLWNAIKINNKYFPAWRALFTSFLGANIYCAIVRSRNS